VNTPPQELPNDITLFAYGRDESSTTLECYMGSALSGGNAEQLIYELSYKAPGAPTFTSIFSFQAGQFGVEPAFITKNYWVYTHKHGASGSSQYRVSVTNPDGFVTTFSNILTVPAFYGFGIKTTRSSSNGPLKRSKKTRNEVPKF